MVIRFKPIIMIQNYFKIAFRSLIKNKGFTFINVLGLALGLATCLLIVFYVFDELSYDKYNTKADRIYRINTDIKFGGNSSSYAVSAPQLAAALKNNFPEVEQSVRMIQSMGTRFKKGSEHINENKVAYADASIFDVFTLPLISGDAKSALVEPHTIVISERAAQKYFNRTDVIGENLFLVNENSNFKVTAVMRNMPEQSHFNFDYLLSMPSLASSRDSNWNNFSFNTYILFKKGDHTNFEAKLNRLIIQHLGAGNYARLIKSGSYIKANLTPLTNIHLQSNRQYELGSNSSLTYVYIFSAIASFILLIACINFMNLSTARSANRAREVGVRKVLGSSRRSLMAQFISESLLVTLFATIIAILVAWVLLPLFNQMSGKNLTVSTQLLGWLFPALIVIITVVGLLAGSYPAFYLSGFKPIEVLKGRLSAGFKGSNFRNFLVVLQFSVSVFLIIGTLVIYNQLNFIQHKNLGFNRDQVLVIKNTDVLDNAKLLKEQIKQIPGVSNATLSGFVPTGSLRAPNSMFTNKIPDPKNALFTEIWPVDEDYLNTMGMGLEKGRNFSVKLITDSGSIIINETAARMAGYYSSPLNHKLYMVTADNRGKNVVKEYNVIGVLKDFNFSSLRDNVTPIVMILGQDKGALSVKMGTENITQDLARIESTWNRLSPNLRLEYSFMNDDFNTAYSFEQRTGKLFLSFTVLALIIACLGLFGLSAYAAEQRQREIGIRKVLGANLINVVTLLSKDFIKLVITAILIATPLAYLAMRHWLQGFAYRENIQWWVIVATGFGAIAIAFITISFQSVKAALSNTAESLRSE